MSFVQFQTDDSVVSSETLVSPMWTGDLTTLNSFFTSSTQELSNTGKFYTEVYNNTVGVNGSEVQFSIAYGNSTGLGSAPFNNLVNENTPTRNIYGQFRNLIFGDENAVFNFGGSNGISRDIFIINYNRSRFKESIRLGSINLVLNNAGNAITLTDNSNSTSATNYVGTSRYYYMVSGSSGNSYNSQDIQTASGSYGLLIPDMGIMVLNPRALALAPNLGGINMAIDETDPSAYVLSYNANNKTFINAIAGGSSFSSQNSETMSSRYFWVRVKNQQFNYTTNPSIIDANGNIVYTSLVDNPQTYVTTIGLYNNSNELLGVAKLSKPLPKDFTKEVTIRVKLDF